MVCDLTLSSSVALPLFAIYLTSLTNVSIPPLSPLVTSSLFAICLPKTSYALIFIGFAGSMIYPWGELAFKYEENMDFPLLLHQLRGILRCPSVEPVVFLTGGVITLFI